MRNVILILLLCLMSTAYGQSELKEIQNGDMNVYRCDSSGVPGLKFSIRYPKSFRAVPGVIRSRVVRFWRTTSPLSVSVYVYDLAHMRDTSQAYYDTAVVKHYQTKYEPVPQADTIRINGHIWSYSERTSEQTMKSGKKWYYRSGHYSRMSKKWLVSVHFSINLDSTEGQTAEVFDQYKGVFMDVMKTLQLEWMPEVSKE